MQLGHSVLSEGVLTFLRVYIGLREAFKDIFFLFEIIYFLIG